MPQVPDAARDLTAAAKRGRPRKFAFEVALSAALDVFLARGYGDASVSELTAAMQVNRPSLYRCFGSKEDLFKRAMRLHSQRHLEYLRRTLGTSKVREAAERLLRDASQRPRARSIRGFGGILAALPRGAETEDIRDELAGHHARSIDVLSARFERARMAGELTDDAKPRALANYLETLVDGISVQSGNGASRTDLDDLVELALLGLERCGGSGDGNGRARETDTSRAECPECEAAIVE
jgi:AcrR family transcriptional regulator